MKKKLFLAAVCLMGTAHLMAQGGPTMGWSSWNTYGVNISDTLIRRQADAMISKGLRAVGYDHINIDDGFFGGRNMETGELLIHPKRFPQRLEARGRLHPFQGAESRHLQRCRRQHLRQYVQWRQAERQRRLLQPRPARRQLLL